MKYGWCAPLKDADLIKQAGFDYIEYPLAAQGLEDRDTFAASKKAIAALPLPAAACNYFMPQDMRVVGPDIDTGRVKNYLARASELMNSAGTQSCVFGSGWSRNIHEGWARDRAEAQFLETLDWCADALRGTSVTLVIEPLNRKESNLINSVAEGARFARLVNRPEIRVLADFFHGRRERAVRHPGRASRMAGARPSRRHWPQKPRHRLLSLRSLLRRAAGGRLRPPDVLRMQCRRPVHRTAAQRQFSSSALVRAGSKPAGRQKGNSTAMKTKLDGQVAIVTGAARGIGLAIAKLLAERGAKVIVWDRDLAPLHNAAGFKPDAAEVVDVASYASIEAAFNKALKAFDKLDILVNNAGINGPIKPTWEYPLEDWDRVIAIDMNSVFYASRLAAKHMRDRKQGRIITVASIAGKEGVPNISAYSAAKAGVIGFSKALAKELADSGVTVNCIAPAMTATDLLTGMTQEHIRNMKAKIPMGRLVEVDEVAELAAWIASPACSFTTGFVFDITGGRATY